MIQIFTFLKLTFCPCLVFCFPNFFKSFDSSGGNMCNFGGQLCTSGNNYALLHSCRYEYRGSENGGGQAI